MQHFRLRLALCNLNPTVGALRSNADRVIAAARAAVARDCELAVASELVLAGYPSEDLVLWPDYVEQQWQELQRIARDTAELNLYLAVGLAVTHAEKIYNCAALVHHGHILGVVPKQHLASYNVFYEGRTFSAGTPGDLTDHRGVPFGDLVFDTPFGKLALEICEDLWVECGPLLSRVERGAQLSVNLSASPWRIGVAEARRDLLRARSRAAGIPLIYVNQVGANDSLIFDGTSLAARNGELIFESPRWVEQISVLDLHAPVPVAIHPDTHSAFFDDLSAALALGIADYFAKTRAFDRLGVSLSGGKDSALVLLLACDAARRLNRDPRDFVHAFSLPTHFNSDATRNVARDLARDLGVTFMEDSIEDAVAVERAAALRLSGVARLAPLTEQNIQARIRALRMWNWSNQSRGLWLQTGNMSEKAVGYTTIGGDLSGGYAPIANVPKTLVTALLTHYQSRLNFASLATLLTLRPSAELAENQEDERDLMPYPVLDACFELFAGRKLPLPEVLRELELRFSDEALKQLDPAYGPGQLKEWLRKFARLFIYSIYKWVQSPQGIHVSDLDLDRERALQLPVVQSTEWLNLTNL
ncbi:MAG: NAD(+) synthase [bacterium]|nr:NAD(+) synthase [bacterium]